MIMYCEDDGLRRELRSLVRRFGDDPAAMFYGAMS
jgi:hypothetical protein